MANSVDIQIGLKGQRSLSFMDYNNSALRAKIHADLKTEFDKVAQVLADCGVTNRQIIDVAGGMAATVSEGNLKTLEQRLDPKKFTVSIVPSIDNTLDMGG